MMSEATMEVPAVNLGAIAEKSSMKGAVVIIFGSCLA